MIILFFFFFKVVLSPRSKRNFFEILSVFARKGVIHTFKLSVVITPLKLHFHWFRINI